MKRYISTTNMNLNKLYIKNTLPNLYNIQIYNFCDKKPIKGGFKEPPLKQSFKEGKIQNINKNESLSQTPFTDRNKQQINKHVTGKRTSRNVTQKIITKSTPDGTFTDSYESESQHSTIKSDEYQVRISVNTTTQTQKILNDNDNNELNGSKITSTTNSKAISFESSDGTETHSTIHEQKTEQIFHKNNDIERINEININIGNPTEIELEWRRNNITPHSIIIHPNRLLPVMGTIKEKQKHSKYSKAFWKEQWKSKWKEVTSFVKTRIVGEQRYKEIEKNIKEGQDNFNSAWEETQNPYVVKLRSALDRLNLQTESSRALEVCQTEFGNDFWVEDFIPEFGEEYLPIIVNAYFGDDIETINKLCIGEAKLFCGKMIEHRINNNIQLPPGFIFIDGDNISIDEIKLSKEKLPQIIISCVVQTIDCQYERNTGKVIDGDPSYIATNYFVLTLEPNLEEEFIKDAPGGMPWQIRTLQTQKQRQLV